MTPIDLFLCAADRDSLLADLLAAGLLIETGPQLLSHPPQTVLGAPAGVAFDDIGPLVDQPAVWDYAQQPPVALTPATFLPGHRANLRLSGPEAAARAEVFAAAAHAAGTVVIDPAEVPAAQRHRWGDAGFPWEPAALPVPPPDAPAPTVSQRRAQLLARLAARRWECEVGGTTLAGLPLATDDRSKLLLLGAADTARRDPDYTVTWKTADGWVLLDAAALIAAAEAVHAHVQACFAREAVLHAAIATAADRETLTPLRAAVEAFWG